MLKNLSLLVISNLFFLGLATSAYAGNGATIAFRSGQLAFIDDGYDQLLVAMQSLERKDSTHKIVKLTVAGGTFLLNVSEVVLICRDRCKSVDFYDQRDPSRGRK